MKRSFFSLETSSEKLFDRQMASVARLSMDSIKRNTIGEKDWERICAMTTEITARNLELIPAAGILLTQTVCGICGKPVDKELKYPHPLSACVDHIVPVAKGGHPSDLSNLQLAHWTCNRQKSDKLLRKSKRADEDETLSNRILPQSCDWTAYRPK